MTYSLYTEATPNPIKVHIALEELALPYRSVPVDFAKDEQKQEPFLTLNPNGKIPVLVDHARNDFVIIESGAILLYLAEKHGRLLPSDSLQRSQAVQWLMWQMGGLGPMFGQLLVFAAAFENSMPEATLRYKKELERLFSVLDRQLDGREFLAGEHSIADIASMAWVPLTERIGWDLSNWPNVQAWSQRCLARPAYIKGIAAAGNIPEEVRMSNFKRATIGLGS
ncbi:glutathione S-transferase family protein [Rhodovibrionaceae bacterium A322]